MPALTLVPVLGSIALLSSQNKLQPEPRIVSGATNSTRWIIDIEQPDVPPPTLEAQVITANSMRENYDKLRSGLVALGETFAAEFQLIHGGNLLAIGIFGFSFGAIDSGFYLAKPWLNYDSVSRVFTLKAYAGAGAKYRLSLDSLHSMHR